MPATTPRGLRYPLISEIPDGWTDMQQLATDVDQRTASGGLFTATTDAAGLMAVPHGLGRAPVGFAAIPHATTSAICVSSATVPNTTNFYMNITNRATGAPVVGSVTVRWVAW